MARGGGGRGGRGGRGGGGRGRGGRGRHGGGHARRHRGRNWYGPVGYPYYGYPYYDDFYDSYQDNPPVVVINRDQGRSSSLPEGLNWPTIALSVALSALLLMRK